MENLSSRKKIFAVIFKNLRGDKKSSRRKINLRVISEPATRIQMIKGGDADICSLIPIEALSNFDQHPELEVRLFPSFVNHLLILNVDKPPTNDIRIRQAIASALDYQSIIDNIYNGVANKPTGLIPQSLSGISPPEKRYKFLFSRVVRSNFQNSYLVLIPSFPRCFCVFPNF